MATIAVAADSHGNPNFAGDGTAKSPTDRRHSNSPWMRVLLGGGIGGGGEVGGDPSNGLTTSLPSSSVPEPTSLSASSAPMENPPPPEPASPSPEHPKAANCSQNSNVGVSNVSKSVWNKPSNKVSAPVVDDSSWPALGQLPKKSPANSPKHPTNGGSIVTEASQVSGASSSRENRNVNPDFHAGKQPPMQQKSSKLGGGGGNRYGGHARGPHPVQHSSVPLVHEVAPKNTSHQAPNVLESSSTETGLAAGSSGDSHVVSDHSIKRRLSRRGNFGQNARGDGSYHRGGRRDHDRGPHGWDNSTVFNARGANGPLPRRGQGGGYVRSPPPGNRPFMASPPPVRPYGNPIFYPNDTPFMYYIPTVPAEHFPAMSFPPPPPPLPLPAYMHNPVLLPDNTLPSMIVKQIDFYLSEANLVKDEFLRSKMDGEGWIPISLIASFPRVKQLTDSIPTILDSLKTSSVVEVQENKIRKRDGWRKWIPHGLFPVSSIEAGFSDDKVVVDDAPTARAPANSDVSMPVNAD